DADEAPGQLRRTKPWLAAPRAVGPLQRALGRLRGLGWASQSAVRIHALGHATRVPGLLLGTGRGMVATQEIRRAHRLSAGRLDPIETECAVRRSEQQLAVPCLDFPAR